MNHRPWRSLYAFTTENIAGYLPLINDIGQKVLTVCGSGDHLLNAVFLGAKDITTFDINEQTAYWLELKLAALKILSYKEFLSFFMFFTQKGAAIDSPTLNYRIFGSLSCMLSEQATNFFMTEYSKNSFEGARLRGSSVFNITHDSPELKIRSNLYLQSEKNYSRLRDALQDIRWTFHHGCITNVFTRFAAKRFDTILLSNISDYASDLYVDSENYLERYCCEVLIPLQCLLSDAGKLLASYIYQSCSKPKAPPRSQIDNEELREKIFQRYFKYRKDLQFSGVVSTGFDRVVCLSLSESQR